MLTVVFSTFGISIPTLDFPGIGASIRISLAANAILISFWRLLILFTRTPRSGFTSNFVTLGPICVATRVALTPNSSSISISLRPLSLAAAMLFIFLFFLPGSFNKVKRGSLYLLKSWVNSDTKVSSLPIVSSMIRLSSCFLCSWNPTTTSLFGM